jgi:TolA-binding protein
MAAEAYFLKGKAQYDLARYDEALASFAEVTRRSRSEVAAKAQFYVGQVYQAKEDLRQALMAYLRIQALYPQYGEWVAASLFEGGKCHQGLGAAEEARGAFRTVVEKHKGTRWAGMAEERLKDL